MDHSKNGDGYKVKLEGNSQGNADQVGEEEAAASLLGLEQSSLSVPGHQLNSIYQLTLEEFQLMSERDFGSMNLDELLNMDGLQDQVEPNQDQFLNQNMKLELNMTINESQSQSQSQSHSREKLNLNLNLSPKEYITQKGKKSVGNASIVSNIPTALPICNNTVVEGVVVKEEQSCKENYLISLIGNGVVLETDKVTEEEVMSFEEFLVKFGVIGSTHENVNNNIQEAVAADANYSSWGTSNNNVDITANQPSMMNYNINMNGGGGEGGGYCGVGGGDVPMINGCSMYPALPTFGSCSTGSKGKGPKPIVGNNIGSRYNNNIARKSNSKMEEKGDAEAQAQAQARMDAKQERLIRNRESAARSRARKLAYTAQLETQVEHLKQVNHKLKLIMGMMNNKETADQANKFKALRRTSSAPW